MERNIRSEDDKLHNAALKIVIVVFGLLIFVTVYVFIYYTLVDSQDGIKVESVQYIDRWTVIEGNGNSFCVGRYYIAKKDYPEDFTIVSTLPEKVKDNSYLCFATGKNIAVYIDGELRKDFVEKRDVKIPGGSVKRFYMLVPLYEKDGGKELKMVRESTTRRGQIVPETIIGTQGAIYGYMMGHYGLSFMLAEVVLLLSAVVILVSIGMRLWYRHKIIMLYGATGIFIVAGWVVTNSMLFPFVFGHYHIDGVMNYMLCLMMPFAPAIYLNMIQHERYKKCMSAIFMISAMNAVIWPSLHFTKIFPLYSALPIITSILGALSFVAIIILMIEVKNGNTAEYKFTAIGFFGCLISALVEVIYMLFFTPKNEEIPMVVGLTFFLTFVVIQQTEDLKKTFKERQQAIDLSEAKTTFLASMSHEIRTPINAILGMNEMILRENQDKTIDDYSRNIKSSGNMLLMLVNDVLDFSKIEAGKLEINEEKYQLSETLYDVMSLIRERAEEKKLELITEVQGEVPDGQIGDEFRIRQILINFLNNAVKYTDTGSVRLITGGEYTSDDRFELYFSVVDTGKGIRKEDQEHLFEAFERADIRKNVNIEGTGLGLAIVKSIVDSMGGKLGVNSEYGKGSEFYVKLPVKVFDKTPLREDYSEKRNVIIAPEEESGFTAPGAVVLAVDDNQSNLTIVKLFLKRTEIILDTCNSGSRAIEMCKSRKYDLILLDHMMPQPDGIETLHRIRTDEDSLNKETTAIVLTANAVAGSRQIYINAGFADYLTKPINSKILEQAVKTFLPQDKIVLQDRKVLQDSADSQESDDDYIEEFLPEDSCEEASNDIISKLSAIEGIDYKTALHYTDNDESILAIVVSDMVSECSERCKRMRQSMAEGDLKSYSIDAHAIKGIMATIGYESFSEKAKQHEFAAKDGNNQFVADNGKAFIDEYEDICRRLN